jgi:hypothetical protein
MYSIPPSLVGCRKTRRLKLEAKGNVATLVLGLDNHGEGAGFETKSEGDQDGGEVDAGEDG